MKRSPLAVVLLTVFIDLLGFGIVIPLLPLYAEAYHPSPAAFGLLMSSYSVMQFLAAPVLGRLSDRVGRRPVLLLSLLGSAGGYLVFAFAHSLGALFAARILAGTTGGNIGTAQAVIADTTSEADRARGMGLIGMAFGFGFIFGPALGGFAVGLGPAAPGLFASALSFVAFLWALVSLPETRPAGTPARVGSVPMLALSRSFAHPRVAPLLILTAVATTAFSSFEVSFSQHLHGRFGLDPSHVAFVFVAVGVTSAVTQGLLVRRLAPRIGEARLVQAGALLLASGFVGLVLAHVMPALLPVVVLIALGAGLLNPGLSSWVSRRAPAGTQGEVLGAFQAMGSLGRIAGPFWGENAYLRYRAPVAYGAAAALEVAAFLLGLYASRRENGGRAAAGATRESSEGP